MLKGTNMVRSRLKGILCRYLGAAHEWKVRRNEIEMAPGHRAVQEITYCVNCGLYSVTSKGLWGWYVEDDAPEGETR